MRACTQIHPWPAARGRSPAPPPASVVARSAQPRTLCVKKRRPDRVGALRATTEADAARSRLRRLVARPDGGLVNKFPARRQATTPTPSGPPRLAGHGSPPFRRDTEIHGKVPCRLDGWAIGYWSSHFPWDSVSREAGFRVGWRRCNASQRRGRGRMRACTRIRPWPAARGRSPASPPASVVARQRAAPHSLRLCAFAYSALKTNPHRVDTRFRGRA